MKVGDLIRCPQHAEDFYGIVLDIVRKNKIKVFYKGQILWEYKWNLEVISESE